MARKLTKAEAGYTIGATPLCRNCAMFIPGIPGGTGRCTAVEGMIDRTAYCSLWNPKDPSRTPSIKPKN